MWHALPANHSANRTIVLAAGTYHLSDSILIRTNGTLEAEVAGTAILDGGGSVRVLDIRNAAVTLHGLVIARGYHSSTNSFARGAGVYIRDATVSLWVCAVIENTLDGMINPAIYNFAGTYSRGGQGAGLYQRNSNVRMHDCTVSGNVIHIAEYISSCACPADHGSKAVVPYGV